MDRTGSDAGIPPNTLAVEAPAKVNLCLRVLGRRDDGYHDLQTVVVPLSLADRLRVHAFADPGTFRTLSLSLDVTGDPALTRSVPLDETNLVIRAATAMAEETGTRGFAEFGLDKRLPAAAGLGGGSSDAAAALGALNRLWGIDLPAGDLIRIGAAVGSDVPALLARRPVLAEGRGEAVTPIRLARLDWVVVTFAFGVSTAQAFGWWDEDGGPTGAEPAGLLDAAAGGGPEAIGPLLQNDLEGPVTARHPAVRDALDLLVTAGCAGVVMCGSGPSVAGLLPAGGGGFDAAVEGELERLSGRGPVRVSSPAG